MRSMFFKLFLGFWLTMILGGAVSVAVVSTFRHLSLEVLKSDMTKKFDDNMAKLVVLLGHTAREMYRCGGQTEYENYIKGLAEGARIRITLIRDDNRTIAGDTISDEYVNLADNARKQPEVSLKKSGETLIVAKYLTTTDGESNVVIGMHTFGPPPGMPPPPDGSDFHHFEPPPKMPPPPAGREFHPFGPPPGMPPPEERELDSLARFVPLFFSRGELIRTSIMLIMVSAVCYILARSLTMPIRRLQKTTQQIAGGDYSARVGKSLERAGDEIIDLGRDFDIMVERTEKVINAQKRLLRDISHELRSPLARLNVALALAKKRFNTDDDSSLKKIGQEADRLNELIGQLLILARLERGAGIHALEPVNLAGLLREVAGDVNFEAFCNGRGVKVVSSAEITVNGSRELLRRAIENIVRNAAQYTAEHTQVEIVLSVGEKEAEIKVIDFGPGVPERDLPHLFEPFYRVAVARERQSGGVGIGLAITEQAVKAHGGKVIACNGEARQGLIVTITLPLQTRPDFFL
jgi:signal transduction histidine kinase